MARYSEQAKAIADIIKDKNQMKAQISGSASSTQVGKRHVARLKCEMYNAYMKTRAINGGFVLSGTAGSAKPYSVLGSTGTGLGSDRASTWVKQANRRWIWNTEALFNLGTLSGLDVTNGDLRVVKS